MSRYPRTQDLSQPDLKTLPEFMKKPIPEVKFFSAFPPLNTVRAPKSVMERAGFEIYKPPRQRHRRTASGATIPSSASSTNNQYPFSPSNSSAPNLKSSRIASAPVPTNVLSKNNSEPAFGGKQRRNFTSVSPSPLSAGFPATPMSNGFPMSPSESIDNKLRNLRVGSTTSPLKNPNHNTTFELGNDSDYSLSNKSLQPIDSNTNKNPNTTAYSNNSNSINNNNNNDNNYNNERNFSSKDIIEFNKPKPSGNGPIPGLKVIDDTYSQNSPSSATQSIETSGVVPSIQIISQDHKRVSGPRPMKTDIDQDQKRVSGPRPMRYDDDDEYVHLGNEHENSTTSNNSRISGTSLTFQPVTAISHEPIKSITFSANGSPEMIDESTNNKGIQDQYYQPNHEQYQNQYQLPHQQLMPQTQQQYHPQQQYEHQYDFQQGHRPQDSVHSVNSNAQSQIPNTPARSKDRKHMSYITTPTSANSSPERYDKFHDALDSQEYEQQQYKSGYVDTPKSFDVQFSSNKLDSFDIKYGIDNSKTDSFDMKYGGNHQQELFQQHLSPLGEYNPHNSLNINVNPHDSFDNKLNSFQPQQQQDHNLQTHRYESEHDEFDNKFDHESHESQSSDLIHAKEQEVEDSLQQLLSMKRELSPPTATSQTFPSINLPRDLNRSSLNSNRLVSGENSSNPIYSSPNNVKRLSTMHTDDMKIYNINNETPQQDMSIIHESNENEDHSINDLSNKFTKVKVTALATPRKRDDLSQQQSPLLFSTTSADGNEHKFHKHTLSNTTTNNIMHRGMSRGSSQNSTPLLPSEQNMSMSPGNLSSGNPALSPHEGSPIMNNNSPYLPHSPPKPKSAPGTGPCRKCGLEISTKEKSIWSKDNQLSGQWHRRCFSCYTCESKFTRGQSCYVFLDQPYCQIHFHHLNGSICKVCGEGVEGECLENEIQEVFHYDCLMCAYCGKLITNDYFLYHDMVLCEEDAETQKKLLEQEGLDDTDNVTKRRTRVMYI